MLESIQHKFLLQILLPYSTAPPRGNVWLKSGALKSCMKGRKSRSKRASCAKSIIRWSLTGNLLANISTFSRFQHFQHFMFSTFQLFQHFNFSKFQLSLEDITLSTFNFQLQLSRLRIANLTPFSLVGGMLG